MRKTLIIVFIVIVSIAIFYFLRPKKAVTPTINEPTETQSSSPASYSYSMTLPEDMKQEGSTIYDVNKKKIGELAPGLLTTEDKITCSEFIKRQKSGGPELKAKETNVSFSSPITPMSENHLNIGENKWTETVWKQDLDGPALPSGQRFWYVRQYCTEKDGTLFLINFYSEKESPSNEISIKSALETFKFISI